MPTPPSPIDALLARRRRHLGPSLSVSYREPLKIVRGRAQYLYDEAGRAYLDGVNNVCHVGHAHPRVVSAIQEQAALLNTNTRYLHDHIVTYAERLTATLPEPLRVCYFVCSGSEANELALRLAQTYTNRKDVILVDHAYHGNTGALIDISPYKFNSPGGKGAPPHVHVAPAPDAFRGRHRAPEPDLGSRYARYVADLAAAHPPAAFIAESILSCGGQIVLPEGYLASAYAAVRRAGGVCIADEVQVGFGRVGSHFWAFETQGVVPDIVTMGKPIGNGHPMAAVVTTPAIADAFDNGMEYFNTFGGNPVSCAAGLAVLDVIRDEDLQQHALDTGRYFLERLRDLMRRHPAIGDVRGLGLFIGIEFVTDRDTRSPDAETASAAVEALKEQGILLSTDGPDHNVIKIKPPMPFDRENAGQVTRALDAWLERRRSGRDAF
ncbi:MAG: aminotransferase class III-fold pyridoxal phosphate-dependent enzyme [Rhodothermales bacterium]